MIENKIEMQPDGSKHCFYRLLVRHAENSAAVEYWQTTQPEQADFITAPKPRASPNSPPASINVERLSRTDADWETLTDLIRVMARGVSPAVVRQAVRSCQLIDSFSKEQCRCIDEHIRTCGNVPEDVAAKFREIDEEYDRSTSEEKQGVNSNAKQA